MCRLEESESDLHAFVDGQLVGDRLDAVIDRLAADPATAERAAAYRDQRALLAALREHPAPALAASNTPTGDLERALRDAVLRQDRVRRMATVGGAIALVAAIGYRSWPRGQRREPMPPLAA
jgi:anti-sigma factor RsiW